MAKSSNPAIVSLVKALRISREDVGKGHVFHDDDDSVVRPEGYASVEWVGSVDPLNAIDGDTWVDTSA